MVWWGKLPPHHFQASSLATAMKDFAEQNDLSLVSPNHSFFGRLKITAMNASLKPLWATTAPSLVYGPRESRWFNAALDCCMGVYPALGKNADCPVSPIHSKVNRIHGAGIYIGEKFPIPSFENTSREIGCLPTRSSPISAILPLGDEPEIIPAIIPRVIVNVVDDHSIWNLDSHHLVDDSVSGVKIPSSVSIGKAHLNSGSVSITLSAFLRARLLAALTKKSSIFRVVIKKAAQILFGFRCKMTGRLARLFDSGFRFDVHKHSMGIGFSVIAQRNTELWRDSYYCCGY